MDLLTKLKGLFQPSIVKEIEGGTWGHLLNAHGMDVDSLSQHIRCIDKSGVKDGIRVKMLRIFSLREVAARGIAVTGWETFDRHPELILFEGYLDSNNTAHLERKNGS